MYRYLSLFLAGTCTISLYTLDFPTGNNCITPATDLHLQASHHSLHTVAQQQLAQMFCHAHLQQTATLEVHKVPLIDVLHMLSVATKYTFLADAKIAKSPITLTVSAMRLSEILKIICHQIEPTLAVIQHDGWWHLLPYQEALQQMSQHLVQTAESEVIQLEHVQLNTASMEALQSGWQKIVGIAEQTDNYLHFDAVRNKVFYRAPTRLAQRFKEYISQLDCPQLSVRLEVAIVIADKNFNFDIGFDWSGIYNRQQTLSAQQDRFGFVGIGGTLMDFPTPDKPVTNPPNRQENTTIFVDPLHFALNLFNSGACLLTGNRHDANRPGAINIPFVFGGSDLSISRLNAVLNAAQQESHLQITNQPSLLTGNHETAKLLIGKSIPLQTTIEDLQTNVMRNITTVNFKEIGTIIEFTPTIAPTGKSLLLDVYIEDSVIVDGSTRANERGVMINPPTIATMKIKNKVELMHGQTTVIGGLAYQYKSDAQSVVPLIYKIPLVGWLFKAMFVRQEEKERYIFITPYIINPSTVESISYS